MKELAKLSRIAKKVDVQAPHEILLTIDATLGATSIEQAKIFHQTLALTGIVLTKIDGSAKGGAILPIYKELHIPIKFLSFGEHINDISLFNINDYIKALLP